LILYQNQSITTLTWRVRVQDPQRLGRCTEHFRCTRLRLQKDLRHQPSTCSHHGSQIRHRTKRGMVTSPHLLIDHRLQLGSLWCQDFHTLCKVIRDNTRAGGLPLPRPTAPLPHPDKRHVIPSLLRWSVSQSFFYRNVSAWDES